MASDGRNETDSRAARRTTRRVWMLALGLAALAAGGLYTYLTKLPAPEKQGWDAYHRGDYERAIAWFDAALARKSDNADAYTGRAWAEVAKNDWAHALADSTEALRLDPTATMAYVARANARAGKDEIPGAEADLNEAIRRDPRLATAYFHRARIGYEHNVKTIAPLADLDKATQIDPNFAPALSLAGLIRYDDGKYDAAIDAADRALRSDPNEALAYFVRGSSRVAKGDAAAGQSDIQKAIALDPRLENLLRAPKQKKV